MGAVKELNDPTGTGEWKRFKDDRLMLDAHAVAEKARQKLAPAKS